MLCLGFSTSTDSGSIALVKNKKILSQTGWQRGANNTRGSEVLTPKIKALLKKHKIEFSDLDLIAVDKGPGSFTGCRVGVSVAKTLAYTINKPLFAVSSLEIMAHQVSTSATQAVACCLDAHKSLFYFQLFSTPDTYAKAPQALSPVSIAEQLQKLTIPVTWLGLLPLEIKNEFPKLLIPRKKTLNSPQAVTLVELSMQSQAENYTSWAQLEPIYIRSPDAVEKLLAHSQN